MERQRKKSPEDIFKEQQRTIFGYDPFEKAKKEEERKKAIQLKLDQLIEEDKKKTAEEEEQMKKDILKEELKLIKGETSNDRKRRILKFTSNIKLNIQDKQNERRREILKLKDQLEPKLKPTVELSELILGMEPDKFKAIEIRTACIYIEGLTSFLSKNNRLATEGIYRVHDKDKIGEDNLISILNNCLSHGLLNYTRIIEEQLGKDYIIQVKTEKSPEIKKKIYTPLKIADAIKSLFMIYNIPLDNFDFYTKYFRYDLAKNTLKYDYSKYIELANKKGIIISEEDKKIINAIVVESLKPPKRGTLIKTKKMKSIDVYKSITKMNELENKINEDMKKWSDEEFNIKITTQYKKQGRLDFDYTFDHKLKFLINVIIPHIELAVAKQKLVPNNKGLTFYRLCKVFIVPLFNMKNKSKYETYLNVDLGCTIINKLRGFNPITAKFDKPLPKLKGGRIYRLNHN